jgi:hypothetical protein
VGNLERHHSCDSVENGCDFNLFSDKQLSNVTSASETLLNSQSKQNNVGVSKQESLLRNLLSSTFLSSNVRKVGVSGFPFQFFRWGECSLPPRGGFLAKGGMLPPPPKGQVMGGNS